MDRTKLHELILFWREHPLSFIRDACLAHVDKSEFSLTPQQEELFLRLEEFIQAKVRVAAGSATEEDKELASKFGISILSGKGVGKTSAVSLLLLWFFSIFPADKKAVVTSVTFSSVRDVLWSELSKILTMCRREDNEYRGIFDDIQMSSERLWTGSDNKTSFCSVRSAKITIGDESSGPLQGLHSKYQIIVVDESSVVDDQIFNSIASTNTGLFNFCVAIGNPNRLRGRAYESHYNPKERRNWIPIHWSSLDSPLVKRTLIEQYLKYGEDSSKYRVNILGLPPMTDSDGLISTEYILEAQHRTIPEEALLKNMVTVGIDCKGGGSDCMAMVARIGPKVLAVRRESTNNFEEQVSKVLAFIKDTKAHQVFIDSGGVGWGLFNSVKRYFKRTTGVDFGSKAVNKRYRNKRAEMYCNLKDAFVDGNVCLCEDSDLFDELCAIKYRDENGVVTLASKEEIRKILGRSPDSSDAYALTYSSTDTMESLFEDREDRAKTAYRRPSRPTGSDNWLAW